MCPCSILIIWHEGRKKINKKTITENFKKKRQNHTARRKHSPFSGVCSFLSLSLSRFTLCVIASFCYSDAFLPPGRTIEIPSHLFPFLKPWCLLSQRDKWRAFNHLTRFSSPRRFLLRSRTQITCDVQTSFGYIIFLSSSTSSWAWSLWYKQRWVHPRRRPRLLRWK